MKTNKQMTFEFLDSVKTTMQFHGRNLKDMIFFATGKEPYTETVLRYARDYCLKTNASLTCLSKSKSKYVFIPKDASVKGALLK